MVSVNEMLHKAIFQLNFLVKEKNIDLNFKQDNNFTLRVDEEIINRVFVNLLSNALKFTPLVQVKIVILGQDPYPNAKDAMGLAFSVGQNQRLPASLKNIFIELEDDLGIKRSDGDLSDWLDQGVMLLNMSLTVMPGVPASHSKIGWQRFTEPIVKSLADHGVIALLWGNQAQEMNKYFENGDSFTAPHPSPLSAYRGFFGSKPFSKVNLRLIEKGITPIKW